MGGALSFSLSCKKGFGVLGFWVAGFCGFWGFRVLEVEVLVFRGVGFWGLWASLCHAKGSSASLSPGKIDMRLPHRSREVSQFRISCACTPVYLVAHRFIVAVVCPKSFSVFMGYSGT